jgi:hypothetical protein
MSQFKSVHELRSEAKAKGLRGYSVARKEQLLHMLGYTGPASQYQDGRHHGVTVRSLKAEAKSLGVKGYSGKKKAELEMLVRGGASHAEMPIPGGPASLSKMTLVQLRELAKREGLHRYSHLRKDELINELSL